MGNKFEHWETHILNSYRPLHVLELVLLAVDLKDARLGDDNRSIGHLIAMIKLSDKGRKQDPLEVIHILHIIH